MSDPLVSIIMRSFNEGWALRETLPALKAQNYRNWELIVIDSGSTDDSVALIRAANPRHFIQIKHSDYNPSRVLNHGMRLARGSLGIFLNADATPQGPHWLRPLVEALADPQVAAVFGRQVPRPVCQAVFAHDYERCFGPNRESARWEHFFSMVSSGLRKELWAQRGFLETLQYSEDDEYTRWCRAQGYRVLYCPASVVMHSHNYSAAQAYRRSFGEAKALAAVWQGKLTDLNWPRTILLGWLADVKRDLAFCVRHRRFEEMPHAAWIRWQQRCAKLAGFRAGWSLYRKSVDASPETRFVPRNGRTADALLPPAPCQKAEASVSASPARTAVHAPGAQARFTIDGNEALERNLDRICAQVTQNLRALIPERALEAVVLGGGYGRGEGGVWQTEGGAQPYNDLEFYVFLRGNRLLNDWRRRSALAELADRLTSQAGLHVEFKIESFARLRRSPVSMFYYDLVAGHRVLFGPEMCFHGCEHLLRPEHLPLAEATRLLFNRCSGLLLARELLDHRTLSRDQADFISRNLAKARLALGDAVLTAFGQYHWSCLERKERLARLREPVPCLETIRSNHAAGVEFKLHPQPLAKSVAEFEVEHRQLCSLASTVWLWLESRRLARDFSSTREYAGSRLAQGPGRAACRNLALNLKAFGWPALLDRFAWHYPRERLFRALALLLWESATDNRIMRHLQSLLKTRASDWAGLVAAYKAAWPGFG